MIFDKRLDRLWLGVVCFLVLAGCSSQAPGVAADAGENPEVNRMFSRQRSPDDRVTIGMTTTAAQTDASDNRENALGVLSVGPDYVVTGSDAHVTYVYQEPTGTRMRYGGGESDSLRAAGAYLRPSQRMAIGVVDPHPWYPLGTRRRIQIHIADVDPNSSPLSRYKIVHNYPLAYQNGTGMMRGLSAASFYDADGNIDGLFAAIDNTSPPSIVLAEVPGDSTTNEPVMTNLSGLFLAAQMAPATRPALAYGWSGGVGKMLFAYNLDWYHTQYIDVGFIVRFPDGHWSWNHSYYLLASGPLGACSQQIDFDIASAYDSAHNEFALGWFCHHAGGSWSALMTRLDWNGQPIDSTPFMAHVDFDSLHTGPQLVFNVDRSEYFFTFQHNSALVNRSPTGLDCVRIPGSTTTCVDYTPACTGNDAYATSSDYWSGESFRFGAPCSSTACGIGTGVSLEMHAGGDPGNGTCASGSVWSPEPGQLWPVRPSGEASSAHAYVRGPASFVTAVLHVWERPGSPTGLLRMSFVDEPPWHAFYE